MGTNGIWQKDNINRSIPGVSSVPSGPGAISVNTTLSAGGFVNFIIKTIPDSERLSLWNWLYSIVVDDDVTTDDEGGYAYLWPTGGSLTTGQAKISVYDRVDWSLSSDLANQRHHIIRIVNNDSTSHTVYLHYKAYTFSAVGPGA